MSIRAFILAVSISLAAGYGARAGDQDGVVDTPEDVQSTSEAATAPDISDENSSYLSGGGFDSGTDTSGSDDDGSDLQPAPLTVTPNEASVPSDPAALSAGFWANWETTKSSANFAALTAAVDCGCGPATDGTQSQGQSTVDIAITRPAEAAQLMSESLASSHDPVSDAALATVINMRTSPEVRQAAAPLVAPEVKARVEEFRANLSTGIPGLPGIYLGEHADGGGRPSLPVGYTPVAGGSMGCPSRY